MDSAAALRIIAQDLSEQAPVTQWPERLLLSAAVLVVTVVAVWAMRRNWRRRAARQEWVVLPPPAPPGFVPEQRFLARYVASVASADWLERIAAHGLGMPGRAEVGVGPQGVRIARQGEQDLFLPVGTIIEAGAARGMAQEVYEAEGLIVITWRSGPGSVTTGLRMARAEDHLALLAAVSQLIATTEGKAEV